MKKRGNYLWVTRENDVYTLSMTPELQDDIGTVGFVEFPELDQVKSGDPVANLEASKTVIEIQTPLAGRVIERNEKASNEPTLLNSAKEEEAWIIKLTDVDEAEFNKLEDE